MPLKTVDVEPREGRVCYVTLEGDDRYVTVECAYERTAYRFVWPGRGQVLPGDWVSFYGKVRREVLSKKDEPERLREIPYYHDPYDGSARSGWTYLDLLEPEGLKRIAPLDKLEALREAERAVGSVLADWYANGPDRIREALSALENASDALRAELGTAAVRERESAAKTVAVDLEV